MENSAPELIGTGPTSLGKQQNPPRFYSFDGEKEKATASSALAELERQRRTGDSESPPSRRYLSWAERQRLVDTPSSPFWPVVVAIGMLAVVSITLSSEDPSGDLGKVLQERLEYPFVPHEAEIMHQKILTEEAEQLDEDSDSDSDVFVKEKKREYISKDEGDRLLDWVEKPLPLDGILLSSTEHKQLVRLAPPHLLPLVHSLRKQATYLRLGSGKHGKLLVLLQQDLVTVAEFALLCRFLSRGGFSKEQKKRLAEQLKLVRKRLEQEWPQALSLTKYIPDAKERNLYLRLISVIAGAVETAGKHVLGDFEERKEEKKKSKEMAWKAMSDKLEMERLLETVKFPEELAEAFKTD